MRLAVVIPVCDPGPELRALLEALTAQAFAGKCELVLLDSSRRADLSAIAGAFGARHVRIDPAAFGHGRTRNRALEFSDAPYLAFFTQDALPADNQVLARLVAALEEVPEAAGAYARQVPHPDATLATRAEVLGWFEEGEGPVVQRPPAAGEWERLDPMARYRRARFDNVASLVRREVLAKIPFPETYFGEDVAWGLAALQAGHALVYEPRARVVHSHDRPAAYEFRRTVNCHARLARMFGLRTVRTPAQAAGGFVRSLGEKGRTLLGALPDDPARITELFALPGREAARAFGQWTGGLLGASGLDERFHFRGV